MTVEYSENFTLRLTPILREKLNYLSAQERRRPGDLLRLLLVDELARRGLMPDRAAYVAGVQEVSHHDPSH